MVGPGLKVKVKGLKKRVALTAPLVFLPGAEPLQLVRRYRGTIQVDKVGQRLRAVNVVGLEQYLYGVVPAEVPDDWGPEVLKAQSVAARSYAPGQPGRSAARSISFPMSAARSTAGWTRRRSPPTPPSTRPPARCSCTPPAW